MNKFKEMYLTVKNKYNPKDKEQINIKNFCSLFIEGKISENEADCFFNYENSNYYINHFILGNTLAEYLEKETNIEIFLMKLKILDKGYPEGNYIAMEAFRETASKNLYDNSKGTTFFDTIKQIPQYINKYPEKFFRFSSYENSNNKTKRYIKIWEKEKNIQDILSGRDLLISNCRLELDCILPVFNAILDKNADDFIQYISLFETPMLLEKISNNIIYSDSDFEKFFEIIKKAPSVIDEKTNQWNTSIVLPIFIHALFNRIQEIYNKALVNNDGGIKISISQKMECLINILLDRKIDGNFMIENLLHSFSKKFFMIKKQNIGNDIANIFLETLKKIMEEKNFLIEDIFKSIEDLTSLALIIYMNDKKPIKKEYIELLGNILNSDDKININYSNFRGLSMFEKIHYNLAYLFSCDEYEKNWLSLWNKFKEKRLSYKMGYTENYSIMNSSVYLLILGTIAIDYLIHEKQQVLNFINLIWNKVIEFYLINKPFSEDFSKNIIPYLITLYCVVGQKEIVYEKFKYIISNKKILFATLATLDANDILFDFIPNDEKDICIKSLSELKEISQFTSINSKIIDENLLDNLIKKLKS